MAKTNDKFMDWQRVMRFFRWLGFIVSLVVIIALVGVIGLYALHRDNIPEVLAVKDYRPSLKSKVFAQNGELIAEFGVNERILVKRGDLPPLVMKAFISSEDKNFYRHHGIDFAGMVNAVLQSVSGQRSSLRGASTITQQLAKSLLVKKEGYEQATARTIARKVKEAILARRLEMHLSKEDILWMYLNEVYLGHGSYGVAAAARTYFHKNLVDLRLGEIALIAGLPQAPSRFSPAANMSAALARQAYVLGRMRDDGYIDAKEQETALSENKNLRVFDRENNFRKSAPYFSETIRKMVIEEYGEDRVYEDGLNIFTTLDLDQERTMQRVLKTGLLDIDKRQGFLGPIFRPANDQEKNRAKGIIDSLEKEDSLGLGNNYRLAMVERIDSFNKVIAITTGSGSGEIPFAGMFWLRPRDPTANYESTARPVLSLLVVGDVILVKELADSDHDESGRLFSLEQEPGIEAAMFAMEPESGYVTALNGGYSFDRSEFNRVFQACRQPGSLFKPIVYSAAIALKKYTPATLIIDAPLTFHDAGNESTWRPKNLGGGFKGEVTVREALTRSMNIPTLNVMADVGVMNVLDWAKKLGITTKLKPELGTGIGSSCVTPFELGRVFSSIANMGISVEPILIKEIKDRDHQRLKFQARKMDPWIQRSDRVALHVEDFLLEKNRVMDKEVAYTTHYLLAEGAKHGTAARVGALGRHIAGKTGTTNDSFDTWFAGYAKNLLALVWIGNDTMDVPLGVYEQGGRTALPLFTRFMDSALNKLPDEDWLIPNTMCLAKIDAKTGLRITGDHPLSFVAPFRCGEEPALLETHPNQTLEQAMEIMGGM